MTKISPSVRAKLINYLDAATLFGLRPCPTPAPDFIESARAAHRKLTLIVAFDTNLELYYFRKANADIFSEDLNLVDAGCNVAASDPLARKASVTTTCEQYKSKFKSSKRFGEKFETKTRIKYESKLPNGKKKFKKMTIFHGAHDGSNDAYWTLRAFLMGIHRVASKKDASLMLTALPRHPFPCEFRVISVDFEGGQNIPRQLGLAEIDSTSLQSLAYDDWIEAINVRSIFCEEEKDYRNPFCLPDTGPQFCDHELYETSADFSRAIMGVFAGDESIPLSGESPSEMSAIELGKALQET